MADVSNAAETSKRPEQFKVLFKGADGTPGVRAPLNVVSMSIEQIGTGNVLEFSFEDLPGFADLPEGAVRAGAAFGIKTSITNTAGSKTLSADEKWDAIEDRAKVILANAWSAERETGPRTNDVVEAAARVQASRGKPMDDAARAAFATRLANEEIKSSDLLKNSAFRAAYDAIKLERWQAKAAKSAEAAKGQASADLDDLIG